MSRENVEICRRAFEAFNRTYTEGAPDYWELLDPEVEWVPMSALLEGTRYHGHDGVRQWMEVMKQDWTSYEVRPERHMDLGDDRVLTMGSWRAQGHGGGVMLEFQQATWLQEFRNGKVVRMQTFTDRKKALEAAGLRAQSGELALEMVRALPVVLPRVFAAFSDPDELAKWWGPEGFSVGSVDFDPRVGGTYRIEMQPPEGDPFYLRGEFREVDPPGRLAFTFVYEDPDLDDVETLVELSFRDRGESTEVVFTQGRFKTEARRELHRDGWTDSFDRLTQVVSQL